MKKTKGMYLGAAVLGALLLIVGMHCSVEAKTLGRVYGNSLHVENEPRSNTSGNFTLGNDDSYFKGDVEIDGTFYSDGDGHFAGQNYVIVPATETIVAASTITANACGGLKRITAASDVTTDTTLTFTAPSASNKGCCMLVVNVGSTYTIYLDSNTLFPVTSAASLAIGPNGSIRVCSDGTYWRHSAWTEY